MTDINDLVSQAKLFVQNTRVAITDCTTRYERMTARTGPALQNLGVMVAQVGRNTEGLRVEHEKRSAKLIELEGKFNSMLDMTKYAAPDIHLREAADNSEGRNKLEFIRSLVVESKTRWQQAAAMEKSIVKNHNAMIANQRAITKTYNREIASVNLTLGLVGKFVNGGQDPPKNLEARMSAATVALENLRENIIDSYSRFDALMMGSR